MSGQGDFERRIGRRGFIFNAAAGAAAVSGWAACWRDPLRGRDPMPFDSGGPGETGESRRRPPPPRGVAASHGAANPAITAIG